MLPAPRRSGHYRVALVCLGNICRSPMADVVLRAKVAEAGLAGRVTVRSSGTGGWHVGEPMDPRAAATLRAGGYDGSDHRAQQLAASWLDEDDLVLAMDAANLTDVAALAGPDGHARRVRLLRDLDPEGPGDVPDPYYGGDQGFTEVLAMVERCCDVLVTEIAALVR